MSALTPSQATDGLATVRQVIAECVRVEIDTVTPEARLVDDLGMDSLDFVDLIFLLEEAFDVVLQGGELDRLTRLDPASEEVMNGDYLSPVLLDRMEPWLRGIASLPDRSQVTPAHLFSLLTVESIWLATRCSLDSPQPDGQG